MSFHQINPHEVWMEFSFSLRCCIDLEDPKLIYWGFIFYFIFLTSINTIFKVWEPSKHKPRFRSIELCGVPSTAVNTCVQEFLKEHGYSILFCIPFIWYCMFRDEWKSISKAPARCMMFDGMHRVGQRLRKRQVKFLTTERCHNGENGALPYN